MSAAPRLQAAGRAIHSKCRPPRSSPASMASNACSATRWSSAVRGWPASAFRRRSRCRARGRSTSAISAIAVAATIVIIALSLVFGRRWLRAFDHLDETAQRVSRGDLSPLQPQPMPTAEMDRLQDTVGSMITNLQRARESIAAQVNDERRMREELQSLQQQVIRQERLAAIGVLVSGVAHELNNPLQAILGFAELLQMQQGHARARARRPDADPEGERPRQRDHPEPVAVWPAGAPSRRRCGCATWSRRSWSCASASSRS